MIKLQNYNQEGVAAVVVMDKAKQAKTKSQIHSLSHMPLVLDLLVRLQAMFLTVIQTKHKNFKTF